MPNSAQHWGADARAEVRRRAFALAAALVRIARAGQTTAPELAAALRKCAAELVAAAETDEAALSRAVHIGTGLSRLAVEESILQYFDLRTITEAAGELLALIAAPQEVQRKDNLQLQDLFAAELQDTHIAAQEEVHNEQTATAPPYEEKDLGTAARVNFSPDTGDSAGGDHAAEQTASEKEKSASTANAAKAEMRQSILLQHIRRSTRPDAAGIGEHEGCRFRDLQEFFPEVSERTLRYDLEKLVREGLVERLRHGRGGTYYRPAPPAAASGGEEM